MPDDTLAAHSHAMLLVPLSSAYGLQAATTTTTWPASSTVRDTASFPLPSLVDCRSLPTRYQPLPMPLSDVCETFLRRRCADQCHQKPTTHHIASKDELQGIDELSDEHQQLVDSMIESQTPHSTAIHTHCFHALTARVVVAHSTYSRSLYCGVITLLVAELPELSEKWGPMAGKRKQSWSEEQLNDSDKDGEMWRQMVEDVEGEADAAESQSKKKSKPAATAAKGKGKGKKKADEDEEEKEEAEEGNEEEENGANGEGKEADDDDKATTAAKGKKGEGGKQQQRKATPAKRKKAAGKAEEAVEKEDEGEADEKKAETEEETEKEAAAASKEKESTGEEGAAEAEEDGEPKATATKKGAKAATGGKQAQAKKKQKS